MSAYAQIKFDDGSLFLGPFQKNYLNVKLEAKDIQLYAQPYLYTDGQYLVSFFGDLAGSLNGWSGLKTWSSVEGDLCFEAVFDSSGYVNIKISICSNLSLKNQWTFSGHFSFEFISLKIFADELKNVFS